MELDDRVTITTPEGVELELQLAGVGTRIIAGTLDLIIQVLLTLALALITGPINGGGTLNDIALVLGAFVIWFFYPILFEVLWRGHTPGKWTMRIRVVRDTGAPIDLPASSVRNLIRVLDGPLLLWLPSIVSVAVTTRNQRPGDMAAGTLVIRSADGRRGRSGAGDTAAGAEGRGEPLRTSLSHRTDLPAWDVTAITPEEIAAVRQFLARRNAIEPQARAQLAHRLATGLAAKTAGSDRDRDPEWFLEALVELKSRRG